MTTIGTLTVKILDRKFLLAILLGFSVGIAYAENVDPECLAVEHTFALNQPAELSALELDVPKWQALKHFRLAAIYIPAGDKPAARKTIRQGLKIVSNALDRSNDDAELLLLGTMLDGQYLLVDRWRFFYNGLRGLRRLGRAEALEPTNPRAHLIRATSKVVLPKLLGGSVGEAIELIEAGLNLRMHDGSTFSSTSLCEDGQWAQVDLLNWLGRAHIKLAEPKLAQMAFQQALKRSPDNHWVKIAISGQGYEWDGANE